MSARADEVIERSGCEAAGPRGLFLQPITASTAASELRFLRRVRLR